MRADGTGLTYAGYIGGDSDDAGLAIAVDSQGNAYVAGMTGSTQATFPDGDGFGALPGPIARTTATGTPSSSRCPPTGAA